MPFRVINILSLFTASTPGIISITGGGGKTTLLFSLAHALAQTGVAVVCTTTTRMYKPSQSDHLDVVLTRHPESLRPGNRPLFAALPATRASPEKVAGFAAPDIDALSERLPGVWILVEADGAARKPLKAPGEHEPVVPQKTAFHIAVVGLRCLNIPFARQSVFRPDEVSAITGLTPGRIVTPASLVPLVAHPEGWFKSSPKGARRILLCNQSDHPHAEASGLLFAEEAAKAAPGYLDGLFIASLKTKGLECISCPTG